jgi:hypothetical protein
MPSSRADLMKDNLQETFRSLALALPSAYENIHRKRPAFRVEKRIFAMLGVTGNSALFTELERETIAVVKLDREDQIDLVARFKSALSATENYGHHGWTYAQLDKLDETALTLILRCAWMHVAPKRLHLHLTPQRRLQ